MKLSELNTEEDYDLLCDIILEIGDITANTKFQNALQKIVTEIGEDRTNAKFIQTIYKNRKSLVNNVLRNNKDGIIRILSLLNKKDIEEIKSQPIFKTIADVTELMKDDELMGFFKQQVQLDPIN